MLCNVWNGFALEDNSAIRHVNHLVIINDVEGKRFIQTCTNVYTYIPVNYAALSILPIYFILYICEHFLLGPDIWRNYHAFPVRVVWRCYEGTHGLVTSNRRLPFRVETHR